MSRKTMVVLLTILLVSLSFGALDDEAKAYHRFGSGDLLVKYAHPFSMSKQNALVVKLGINISSKSWFFNGAFGLASKLGYFSLSPLGTVTIEDSAVGKPFLGATSLELTGNFRKPSKWESEVKGIFNLSWKDKDSMLGRRISLSQYCYVIYTFIGSDAGGMAGGFQEDLKITKDGRSVYLGPRVERILNDRLRVYAAVGRLLYSTPIKPAPPFSSWCELKLKLKI